MPRKLPRAGVFALAFLLLWPLSRPVPAGAELPEPTLPAAPSAAEPAAAPGREPNALLVLDTAGVQAMWQAVAAVEAQGGHIVHLYPPHVAVGYVPPRADGALRGSAGIAAIHRGTLDPAAVSSYGPEAVRAVRAWNARQEPRALAVPTPTPGRLPNPPVGDALMAPPPAGGARAAVSASAAPGPDQTSVFMIGTVAVGIILPESSGHGEDWTYPAGTNRAQDTIASVEQGLEWWALQEERAGLTFVYDVHYPLTISVEPILQSDEGTWISRTMIAMGYSSPGSYHDAYFDQVRAYINDLRDTYRTDWAFAVFVADSYNDTDGYFPNGLFAYSYLGGPFMVMTYDNDNWQSWRMDMITSHEVGHIFLALDEYDDVRVPACTTYGGYLGVQNRNSLVPERNACLSDVDCVMRCATWPAPPPCLYTRGQVGWRDSDSDGILDPVDTVSLMLDSRPPDLTSRATGTYTGTVSNTPWPASTNDYYWLGATSINSTTAVIFRMDDAKPWLPATALDGAFDEDSETFTLTTPVLADGVHTATIRSANRWGPERRDTFTVDTTPPSVAISLPLKYPGAHFRDCQVAWSGEDAASGVASYDLQYRSGEAGAWTGWLTATTVTSATFVAPTAADATYYFHARARDRAGNVSDYTDPVSYTVKICPTDPITGDAYEADDTPGTARWIGVDGSPQLHNMHDAGDQDWVRFYAGGRTVYTLTTGNDGGYADTVLKLYNTNGTTVITTNDNISGSLASRIV